MGTLSWQTRVGKLTFVCVNGIKTVGKTHISIWRQQFANVFAACFCAVNTSTWVCQHEFANLSLLCEGRFRALSRKKYDKRHLTITDFFSKFCLILDHRYRY